MTSTAPRSPGARTAEPSAATSATGASGLRARLLQGARQGRWLRPVLLANLVAQVVIVITGGVVRLTGSGLGCPDWPTCAAGSIAPVVHQAEGFHKYIEFGKTGKLDVGVYVLPKILDEQVALLHLDHVNAKLSKLSDVQAEYLGLPVEGPFKSDIYRY